MESNILPLCILCGSETTEVTIAHGSTLIICPNCQEYSLVEGLAAELAKQSAESRRDLARAMRWHFYRREPEEAPIALPDLNVSQLLVARHKEFVKEKRDDVGAEALVSTGDVADPWHEPIIRLGRAVGMPDHEALVFAKDLEARGIVRIVAAYMVRASPGEQSFTQARRWERCEEKDGAESEGSE